MFCSRFLSSGPYGRFNGYGGGAMYIMMGFGFIIFIGLIFLAFKLMKVNTHFTLSNNPALNILNERYAKGEINEEEYAKKKILLSKKN
ncbi:MAG TPA: SHOCT domain-containing protein [Clostridiaceae bacterium]